MLFVFINTSPDSELLRGNSFCNAKKYSIGMVKWDGSTDASESGTKEFRTYVDNGLMYNH